MTPLVLMPTTVLNADVRRNLRSTKSQTWELAEPALTQDPYVFSEIC